MQKGLNKNEFSEFTIYYKDSGINSGIIYCPYINFWTFLAFVGWLSLKFLHNMPKAFRLQNGRNLPRPLICFLNQPREHRPKKRTGTLRGHYYFQKTNKTKTKKIAYQCLHHSLPSQNAKFTIWIIFKKSSCFSPG
jgi:hypothetical protein